MDNSVASEEDLQTPNCRDHYSHSHFSFLGISSFPINGTICNAAAAVAAAVTTTVVIMVTVYLS